MDNIGLIVPVIAMIGVAFMAGFIVSWMLFDFVYKKIRKTKLSQLSKKEVQNDSAMDVHLLRMQINNLSREIRNLKDENSSQVST